MPDIVIILWVAQLAAVVYMAYGLIHVIWGHIGRLARIAMQKDLYPCTQQTKMGIWTMFTGAAVAMAVGAVLRKQGLEAFAWAVLGAAFQEWAGNAKERMKSPPPKQDRWAKHNSTKKRRKR